MRNLLITICVVVLAGCTTGRKTTLDAPSGNGAGKGVLILNGVDYTDVSAGYRSTKDIELRKIYGHLSWKVACRALETEGTEEYLKSTIKTGKNPENVRAAKALLYMRDGKSYRHEMEDGFKRFRNELKEIRKLFADYVQVKNSKKPSGEVFGLLQNKCNDIQNYAVCWAACFYHQDPEAIKLVLYGLSFEKRHPDDNAADRICRSNARLIQDFAWNWTLYRAALPYLESRDKTLRRLAAIYLGRRAKVPNPEEASKDTIVRLTKMYEQNIERLELTDRLEPLAKLKRDAQKDRMERDAELNRDENLRKAKAAYEVATGEEKKSLALLLDKLDRVDLTKQFGYPYPGRPLNKELAKRELGTLLYRLKHDFEGDRLRLLPLVERKRPAVTEKILDHERKFYSCKLGMGGEAAAVDEGHQFLDYMNDLLSGKKKKKIHERPAWKIAIQARRFNGMANATTDEEYFKWREWEGRHYDDDFLKEFEKFPKTFTSWCDYMERNYKLNQYMESYILVKIHDLHVIDRMLIRLKTKRLGREEYQKQKDALESKLEPRTPEEIKAAVKLVRLHMKEAKAFINGEVKECLFFSNLKKDDLQQDCAAYVLWDALMNAKSFKEYVTLEQSIPSYYRWFKYTKFVEKFPELLKTYEATLATLLKNHPELAPPAENEKK